MKRVFAGVAVLLFSAAASAGVVYEIEITDAEKAVASSSEFSAQDNLLKMTGGRGRR